MYKYRVKGEVTLEHGIASINTVLEAKTIGEAIDEAVPFKEHILKINLTVIREPKNEIQ